jgi:hypothetical protein
MPGKALLRACSPSQAGTLEGCREVHVYTGTTNWPKATRFQHMSLAGVYMDKYQNLPYEEQTSYWIKRFSNQKDKHGKKFDGNAHRFPSIPGPAVVVIPAAFQDILPSILFPWFV